MPVASARAPAKPYRHAGAHADPGPLSLAATKSRSKLYNPRHPERSVLYHTVAAHFETWLALSGAGQFDGQGDHHTPPAYVEQAFRKYLECGIFAHGFARVWCEDCAHDYLVAFSCQGRGVCPSCNARRMDETAAPARRSPWIGCVSAAPIWSITAPSGSAPANKQIWCSRRWSAGAAVTRKISG